MIYTNIIAESHDKETAMHLWLDGMVDEEQDTNEEGVLVPSLAALCGAQLESTAEDPEPYVEPAKDTWADTLADLLGDSNLCEECRTRAAVYFDRQEEIHLKATNHEVPECPECTEAGRDNYKRKAKILNIVHREDETVVERRMECHECGHEYEDEITMEELT